MSVYPLLMAPSFRHGEETPWGGTMLRDVILKDAPDGPVGESLEVSLLPGHESMVANGAHAGKSLSRMVELWGEELTGPATEGFPLLLKLIDVETPLSVHVYPDDAYAREHEGMPGMSEALVVLNAEPGAKVVHGLEVYGDELRERIAEGRLEESLHWESVRPGDVIYVPAGTVHAMGGGILSYTIQQTSGLSYRLWDWNRVNAEGQSRPLHVEKAVEIAAPARYPAKLYGTTVLCKGGSRTYYVSDAHFELCRLNVSGRMPLEGGRMLFLTALAPCVLRWGEDSLEVNPFDSVLVPAAMEGLTVEGDAKLLMAGQPNRPALIEELGYRAENVAGLLD